MLIEIQCVAAFHNFIALYRFALCTFLFLSEANPKLSPEMMGSVDQGFKKHKQCLSSGQLHLSLSSGPTA